MISKYYKLSLLLYFFTAFNLAREIQKISGPKLVDFKKELSGIEFKTRIEDLRRKVENFASKFPMPGRDDF